MRRASVRRGAGFLKGIVGAPGTRQNGAEQPSARPLLPVSNLRVRGGGPSFRNESPEVAWLGVPDREEDDDARMLEVDVDPRGNLRLQFAGLGRR